MKSNTVQNLVSDEALAATRVIPEGIFLSVLEWTVVPTVDFVLVRIRKDGQREFMLAKRKEEPFKGCWFVPGGRILRGEKIVNALKRQVKRELDLDTNEFIVEFRGLIEVLNPASEGDSRRPEWHSIWNLFEIQIPLNVEPKPLAENAEVKWFTKIEQDFPEPVKEALIFLGFELGNA